MNNEYFQIAIIIQSGQEKKMAGDGENYKQIGLLTMGLYDLGEFVLIIEKSKKNISNNLNI